MQADGVLTGPVSLGSFNYMGRFAQRESGLPIAVTD